MIARQMDKFSLFFLALILSCSCQQHEAIEKQSPLQPQPSAKVYSIAWQNNLLGYLPIFAITPDGGTISIGSTLDDQNDVMIRKLDVSGTQMWSRTFVDVGYGQATGITSTKDGGYVIIASIQEPSNAKITGYHSNPDHWTSDVWVLKLDADGNLMKQKVIGGTDDEYATAIAETADGKLIISGSSASNDGDLQGINSHGSTDAWILKLDGDLNILMQKKMGGSKPDDVTSMALTSSGEILLAVHTQSSDGDVTGFHSGPTGPGVISGDFWVVKTDMNGSVVWKKDLGGSHDDWPFSVIELKDQSIIVSGATMSSDGDVTGYHNYIDHGVSNVWDDGWVLKLSANGDVIWKKCFGGSGSDNFKGVVETEDHSIFLVGTTTSKDGDVLGNHDNADAWIVQLDSNGDILSQRCWGGSRSDSGNSIRVSNGVLMLDVEGSSVDGDLEGNQNLSPNSWLVKVP